jgi:hypothetical protein
MKKLILLLGVFIFISLISCQQKPIKREIFMGFELGSTLEEYTNKLNTYKDNGAFQSIYDVPYLSNRILPNKIFYSIPYVYYVRGKSLTINKLILFFCTQERDIVSTRKNNANKEPYLNIVDNTSSFTNETIPSTSEITNKLISDLSRKYGFYDKSDTLDLSDRKIINYLWKDKNGINIKIEQTTGTFSLFANRSTITMEYSLIDELNEKLISNSSTY